MRRRIESELISTSMKSISTTTIFSHLEFGERSYRELRNPGRLGELVTHSEADDGVREQKDRPREKEKSMRVLERETRTINHKDSR